MNLPQVLTDPLATPHGPELWVGALHDIAEGQTVVVAFDLHTPRLVRAKTAGWLEVVDQ